MRKVLDVKIGYLIESLLENGQTVPLNVSRWCGAFEMGNGHHRMCAMLLCGFETVDIVVTENLDFYQSEDNYLDISYSDEAEEIFDAMVHALRSVYYAAVFAKEMA